MVTRESDCAKWNSEKEFIYISVILYTILVHSIAVMTADPILLQNNVNGIQIDGLNKHRAHSTLEELKNNRKKMII